MTPEEADWAARTKMDQKITHISVFIGRLVDILTKRYGVEDLIDPMAKHTHPAAGPLLMADSPAVQSALLSLA